MHNIDFINLKTNTFNDGIAKEDEFKEKKIELYRQTVEFIEKLK